MSKVDLGIIASVTVTYHPDAVVLYSQLRALPPEARKVLVDNGSSEDAFAAMAPLLESIPNLEVLRLGENRGLAAAINAGAWHVARSGGARWLLMLDQDSEPAAHSIERLATAFDSLSATGVPVGAVGPALLDPVTDRRHGFHVIDGLRWRRHDLEDGVPVRCDGLNGSGTLVDLALFEELGGLDEGLFIDHVDTDFSFRMAAAGRLMFGVPDAQFVHRMGDHSLRVWLGGWRVWPVRSPLRHRYLFRNAIRLMQRPYVPMVWKVWAIPKLILTAIVFCLTGPNRWQQLVSMARGTADGFRRPT